jgi:hypothetical protein
MRVEGGRREAQVVKKGQNCCPNRGHRDAFACIKDTTQDISILSCPLVDLHPLGGGHVTLSAEPRGVGVSLRLQAAPAQLTTWCPHQCMHCKLTLQGGSPGTCPPRGSVKTCLPTLGLGSSCSGVLHTFPSSGLILHGANYPLCVTYRFQKVKDIKEVAGSHSTLCKKKKKTSISDDVEALKPSYIAGGNSYTLKWLILCYVNFTSINNNNNDEKNYLVGETINSRKMQLMILSTWVLPVVIIVVIITIIWIIWL